MNFLKEVSLALCLSRFCLLALPIAIAAGNGIADIVLSLTALFAMIEVAIRRDTTWLQPKWVQAALLLWLYMVVRSLFAPDPWQALSLTLPFLRFPLFAALVPVIWHTALTRPLTTVWLSTLAFLSGDTLFQYMVGHDLFGRLPEDGSYRLTGPYSDYRVGATLLWLGLPVIPMAIMQRRWPIIIIATTVIAAIYFSGERMPLGLLLLGLGSMVLLLPGALRRYVLMGGVACAAVIALMLMRFPEHIPHKWRTTPEVLEHFWHSPYGQLWLSGIDLATDYPIFGAGPNHYQKFCPDYMQIKPEEWCTRHPHNYYIEWWCEYGLVGVALFLLMACSWLYEIRLRWPLLRHHPFWIGGIICIGLKLFPLALATSFFKNWAAVPFWFMLGWWLAIRPQDPENHV
jgi:O-antigen ligase